MGTINERIRITLEFISKNFINPMTTANKMMEKFNGGFKENAKVVQKASKRTKDAGNVVKQSAIQHATFGSVMRMNTEQLKSLNERQHLMRNRMARSALAIRKATHGMRGFKMEMLGVMFFGMAMNRMFLGLANTSMEWFGVMEILSLGLGILFIPLAEKMLNWAIAFLNWTVKLTQKQKEFYSKLVLVGIVLGLVLFLFGTLALGIGSLILAFGFLFSPIGLVITALTTLAGYVFLKNMFEDVADASEYAGVKLLRFGVSGEVFDTMKRKIIEWSEVFKQKLSEVRGRIGTWIAELLPMLLIAGSDMLMNIIDGIVNNSHKIGGAIKEVINNIFIWLSNNTGKILEAGLGILQTIIDGIVNNMDKLFDVVAKIAEKLAIFVQQNIGNFIQIGITIGAAIIKGIFKAFDIKGALKGALLGAAIGSPGGPLGAAIGAGSGFMAGGFTLGDRNIISDPGRNSRNNTAPTINLGSGSSPNVSITNNFNGFTVGELTRELDDRDRKMVIHLERSR